MIASGVTQVDIYPVRSSAGLTVRIGNNFCYLMTSTFKDKELDRDFELVAQTWKLNFDWKSSLLMLMCWQKDLYRGEESG